MSDGMTWKGSFDFGPATARLVAAAQDAALEAAELVGRASQPLVPTESGTLRDSMRVSVETDAAAATGAVSYGTTHAVRVHEDLDDHHTNGQAKFLEQPLTESADRIRQVAAAHLRKAMS